MPQLNVAVGAGSGDVSDDGVLYKASLLDYYYERRATSSIGVGERFVMAKAWFGTSDLVTANPNGAGWLIADIPSGFANADFKNKFAESDLICNYADGRITLRAELQDKNLPDNTPYDFNTLVIVDAEDNVCIALCIQQDTLYRGKKFIAVLTIETRIA
ncbi:TPA: phage tail protein [Enterobacter kobei]|uniref:phage tail protein n=1 Tax=Enterobacter kobei TaxID=208224 RepID=UPI0021C08B0F|nr:phage tail protein [Enterobacter kobei]UXJ66754.1 phage tail protein [Enterobacter kobei]